MAHRSVKKQVTLLAFDLSRGLKASSFYLNVTIAEKSAYVRRFSVELQLAYWYIGQQLPVGAFRNMENEK